MNDTINPVLLKYIEWKKLTDEEKINQALPLTQREFSRINEVSEPQLSVWNRELDLVEVKPSEIAELKEHVLKAAMKGDNAQMAKLAWDIVNPDKKEVKEAEFTADDYISIGIKVTEQLRNSYREGGGSCPVCGECKLLRHEARLDTEPEHEEDREVAPVAIPARPE